MERMERGVDCFILRSYPICRQCTNNFIARCSFKAAHTYMEFRPFVRSFCAFLFKLSDYILRYSGVKWVYMKASRRKQSTFRDAKARFPEK